MEEKQDYVYFRKFRPPLSQSADIFCPFNYHMLCLENFPGRYDKYFSDYALEASLAKKSDSFTAISNKYFCKNLQ